MADYIDREEVIKVITNNEDLLSTYGTADRTEETIAKIKSMPSADAVEVVRCKDCKHSWESIGGIECGKSERIVDVDYFCKWGEKE